MNVLAIDTCLGAVSVAIGRHSAGGGFDISETYEEVTSGHAERLMPMVEHAMATAGIAFSDLSRLAVTLGPGTFTGVRTGIAAARAFRLAARLEVVGMTSLAVMAERVISGSGPAQKSRPVLVAVDARRGRLFVQMFGTSALDPLTEALELTAAEVVTLAVGHEILIAGSGAQAVANAAAGSGAALEIVPGTLEPHAGDLARLAPSLVPRLDISPLYLRAPDAKPQSGKRLARTR